MDLERWRVSEPSDTGDVGDDLSSLLRDLKSMHIFESIIVKRYCYFHGETSWYDTTYNRYEMWVTDSCYRNKRLIGNDSGHHPVFWELFFPFYKRQSNVHPACFGITSQQFRDEKTKKYRRWYGGYYLQWSAVTSSRCVKIMLGSPHETAGWN